MPTYEYCCDACKVSWEVVKPMSALDDSEGCPDCQKSGQRMISRTHYYGADDWNTQTWNPALGCYTRSNAHARQMAKRQGMEEVGNEPVDKIHAHFEKKREEMQAQRWAEADRVKQYGD